MTNKTNNDLYHHGILGMKWGVRRYQNKDGSLTPAGKKRVAKMKDEYTALTGKKLIRKPTPKDDKNQNGEQDIRKKSNRELSETDLRSKINRLQLEKQAAQLENDTATPGRKFISTVGKQVIAPAAIEAGKRLLTDTLMKIGKEKLGLNPEDTKDALSELRKEVDTLELNKRKAVAEDYFTKRKQKEESTNSKKDQPKAEKVKAKVVKEEKENESSKKKEDVIIDAEWTEMSSNSTALVPYRNEGRSFVDDLFKK